VLKDQDTKKFKIGIIGYGYWGRIYYRILSQIQNVDIKFICDANKGVIEKIPLGVNYYDDPNKAIENSDVDKIFIITPAFTHKDLIGIAIKNNIDTFVEKPALLSIKDFDYINEIKNGNTLFYPGNVYAHNDMVKALSKYIDLEKEKITSISANRLSLGPIREDVGCLWDLFPHDLTIFDMLKIGEPAVISCNASFPLKSSREDTAFCQVKYSSGLQVTVQLSWLYPIKIRQTVISTNQRFFIFDETNKDYPLSVMEFSKNLKDTINNIAYNRLQPNDFFKKINYNPSEPLKNMILSFLGSNSFEDSKEEIIRTRKIIKTIESALVSIKKNGSSIDILA